MTANPDSALRQALTALAPFALHFFYYAAGNEHGLPMQDADYIDKGNVITFGDLRRASEAHAIIIEALQRGEKNG